MKCIYILWLLFLKLVCCELEVRIADGILKGQALQSRDGRIYYSYTGIPYAKPPIGELRFKAPESVEPWKGILDVSSESNKICVQNNFTDSHEDCLYLNVFTPKVNKTFLPVMFWIHGGRFSLGHGGPNAHGPEYFMDKDVVLVSINYRLGILGFLSTEDDEIPGNYGMKDQVMALRWVQKNIVHFNGDPNQVTIFGESSGAACTGFHMLSPMSKGLFHKVILQSGTPVCKWAISPIGLSRKRAHAVATIAGCNFDTSEDILKCLRKLSSKSIIDLQNRLYVWLSHPCIHFNPVIENCNSGQESFLCHHPIYDFRQESFVPAIIGLNSAEGGMFVSSLYNSTSLINTDFQTYFNRLLSIMLFYNQYTKLEELDKIGDRVLKEYFPSGRLDDNTHLNAVNMIGDGCFTHCVIDMAKRLSSPVYIYYYDYQNEFSNNKLFGSCQRSLGVTHADELTSLFKNSRLSSKDLNVDDLKVSRLLVNVWYRFVTFENPTIDGTDAGPAWPKFTFNEHFEILHIDSAQPKIIQNPFYEKYKFWNQLPFSFNLNQTIPPKKSLNSKTEL